MTMNVTTTRWLGRVFDAQSAASYTVGVMLFVSTPSLHASDTTQATFAAWTFVLVSANWDTAP